MYIVQRSYDNKFFHGSFAHIISRLWNWLPAFVKNARDVASFRRHLKKTRTFLAVNTITAFDIFLINWIVYIFQYLKHS